MSIVALAFGAIAIPQLKQQLLPSIELPMVSVLAPYQGASPDALEGVDAMGGATSADPAPGPDALRDARTA
ncbi:hypothetical protein QQY66_12770 [Streptomyces sp. DG2A-72]|uniref:hypothetical protein n=1 Tax=Streptomyces sp. DG2A-72 TaxID=3051386 RepID=UPI00265BC5E2|nr:hypothetical protein [Streptomyces sp. DG2A-72]MDO0932526.1 hypothetical protein [Streptomyces sp. DG2A-72]